MCKTVSRVSTFSLPRPFLNALFFISRAGSHPPRKSLLFTVEFLYFCLRTQRSPSWILTEQLLSVCLQLLCFAVVLAGGFLFSASVGVTRGLKAAKPSLNVAVTAFHGSDVHDFYYLYFQNYNFPLTED